MSLHSLLMTTQEERGGHFIMQWLHKWEVRAHRGSAHPHQPQPHPSSNPANALDATNQGTDIRGSTCTYFKYHDTELSQGVLGGKARSSYGSSFLARLPHTSHFLNCPTLQTSSLRRLAKNLKPRFQPLYCTLIPFFYPFTCDHVHIFWFLM